MTEMVILGLGWLDKWAPTFSWEDGYWKLKLGLGSLPPPNPVGKRSVHPPEGKGAAATLEPWPGNPQIPREYQDLVGVFSKGECNVLSPHHSTDCTIEFMPGAKLPKLQMFSMTSREMTELRNCINTNLA